MPSSSWVRCFICTAFLYAASAEQGTDGKESRRHSNICNNCICYDQEGRIYNLTSLQNLDKPQDPSFTATGLSGNYTYSYSPCRPFQLGGDIGNCRDDVAICRSVTDVSYEAIGEEKGVKFAYHTKWKSPHLRYNSSYNSSGSWKPTVRLTCDQTIIKNAKFEVVDDWYSWTFRLTHKCACPDACPIDPNDPVDPSASSQNDEKKIFIPLGAVGALLVIVVLILWVRHRRRNNNDNQRRHLLDQQGRGYQQIVNPIGGRRSHPALPARSYSSNNITVPNKDDFNNHSASV